VARIFLSYARADETQVRGVYRRLLDAGFEVWMDKINLLPGQRWEQEIPRAIRNSDFILIFFSKNSVARRGYIQREFRLALETLQEMPADAIHTIPIRLDDCQIPEQFRPLQWSDLSEVGEFDRIVRALRLGMEQRQTGAPEPALEPPPEPRPDRDRPFSGAEGPSGADASVYPAREPEPATVSPPKKPLVPDQTPRRVSVVTIVGLVIAAVSVLAAVIMVPDVREWLGLDGPREITARLKLKQLPEPPKPAPPVAVGIYPQQPQTPPAPPMTQSYAVEERQGLRVEAITPELARSLRLDNTKGVVVSRVAPDSPAAEAGIQRGDIVREVNRQLVTDLDSYAEATSHLTPNTPALFLLERRGSSLYVALKPTKEG
jgi:hypothetical protein